MAGISVRPAVASDGQFLADMAIEAANWRPHAHRPRNEVLADPFYARFLAGWMRPSDLGMVAVNRAGEAIGAAWLRTFTQPEGGDSFIAVGVPELIVGVRPIWRAQGVGRELIRKLCTEARGKGIARIVLSVDRENYAISLYRSEGFASVKTTFARETMVKHLR